MCNTSPSTTLKALNEHESKLFAVSRECLRDLLTVKNSQNVRDAEKLKFAVLFIGAMVANASRKITEPFDFATPAKQFSLKEDLFRRAVDSGLMSSEERLTHYLPDCTVLLAKHILGHFSTEHADLLVPAFLNEAYARAKQGSLPAATPAKKADLPAKTGTATPSGSSHSPTPLAPPSKAPVKPASVSSRLSALALDSDPSK